MESDFSTEIGTLEQDVPAKELAGGVPGRAPSY